MKSLVQTDDLLWIAPARLIVGIMLIIPIGGGINTLLSICHEAAPSAELGGTALHFCQLLRGIELITGLSFIFGLFVRALALPALIDLLIRVVSNSGASLLRNTSPPQHIVMLRGDWSFAAMYIGAIIVAYDLFRVGAGAYSVDYWLSRRFRTGREGHS
jgi:putative oxidoreductase